MCFGDPWEGKVDPGRPAGVAARLVELGCSTISLGDTIGVATGQVVAVLDRVEAAGVPRDRIALHLHDTYGQALANVLAGLEAGITEFDSSAGDSVVARTRNRRLATWQPRIWCGCSTVSASTPVSTCQPWCRPAAGSPPNWAARRHPGWLPRGAPERLG